MVYQMVGWSNWSGSAAGLSRFTLRFPDHRTEMAFVQHRAEELLRAVRFAAASVFALIAGLIIMNCYSGNLDPSHAMYAEGVRSGHTQMVVRVCLGALFAFVAVLIVISTLVPRLVGIVGPVAREYSTVFVIIVFLLAAVSMNNYYMAKMFGTDPDIVFRHDEMYSDSFVLLVISCFVTSASVMLPIRWYLMSPLYVSAPLLYGGIFLGLGSPEGSPGTNLLLLTVLVWAAAVGQRGAECEARLSFQRWLNEKRLRVEAEHHLSRMDELRTPSAQSKHDQSSTSSGSESLTILSASELPSLQEAAVEETLAKIADIGEQEHWRLRAEDITMHSQMVLGEGAFSVILAATFHGSPAVVKVPKNCNTNVASLKQICNELRILRHVRHQDIVLFHGAVVDLEQGNVSLVLELVEGRTIDAFLQICDPCDAVYPSVSNRYHVLLCLCRALLYLHSQRPCIIHGDLSSTNILVQCIGSAARPKLLDFGLGRLLVRGAKPLGGTLAWMAPELRNSPRPRPSTRADVFSFGRLAYFITTGIKPSRGAKRGRRSSLHWPQQNQLEFVCKALVERCVQLVPKQRPAMTDIHEILVKLSHVCDLIQSGASTDMVTTAATASVAGTTLTTICEASGCEDSGGIHTSMECEGPVTATGVHLDMQLAFPKFRPTPEDTRRTMVIQQILMWNYKLPAQPRCCQYHSAMQVMIDDCTKLAALQCRQLHSDSIATQCPECGVLNGVQQPGGPFLCQGCGAEVDFMAQSDGMSVGILANAASNQSAGVNLPVGIVTGGLPHVSGEDPHRRIGTDVAISL